VVCDVMIMCVVVVVVVVVCLCVCVCVCVCVCSCIIHVRWFVLSFCSYCSVRIRSGHYLKAIQKKFPKVATGTTIVIASPSQSIAVIVVFILVVIMSPLLSSTIRHFPSVA